MSISERAMLFSKMITKSGNMTLQWSHHHKNNWIWHKWLCYDFVAKYNLSLNLTTIQNGPQLRSPVIMETESETKSWFPQQHTHKYARHISFVASWYSGYPVTLTFDLRSRKVVHRKIFFIYVEPRNMIIIFTLFSNILTVELDPRVTHS